MRSMWNTAIHASSFELSHERTETEASVTIMSGGAWICLDLRFAQRSADVPAKKHLKSLDIGKTKRLSTKQIPKARRT